MTHVGRARVLATDVRGPAKPPKNTQDIAAQRFENIGARGAPGCRVAVSRRLWRGYDKPRASGATRGKPRRRGSSGGRKGQGEAEGGSRPGGGLVAQLAAEGGEQLTADGEPQPATAETGMGGGAVEPQIQGELLKRGGVETGPAVAY